MTKRGKTDCPIDVCDGAGWIDLTEDPDSEQQRCPCGVATPAVRTAQVAELHDRIMGAIRDAEPPAEVAERLQLVAEAEARAKQRRHELLNQRRMQQLLNSYLNREGDRR